MKMNRKIAMISVAVLMGISPVMGLAAPSSSAVVRAASIYSTVGTNRIKVTANTNLVNANGTKLAEAVEKGGSHRVYAVKNIKGSTYFSIQKSNRYWLPASATTGTVTYKKGGLTYTVSASATQTLAPLAEKAPSARTRILTLSHNAYVYNSKGKRVTEGLGKFYLVKGSTHTYYGTKRIKGKKYYYLGQGQYIKAGNVRLGGSSSAASSTSTNVKPHAGATPTNPNEPTLTLKKNALPYTSTGKRIYNYLGYTYIKRGSTINYYGTKRIKGKLYYYIGDSAYIKAANVGSIRGGSSTVKPHAAAAPTASNKNSVAASLAMPRGKTTITLKRASYAYDKSGKRINNYLGFTYINKNTVLNYYGTKRINGSNYYYIGDGAYVNAANVGRVTK